MYSIERIEGEIGIEIESVDLDGVFTDALLALGGVFSDATAQRGAPVTHEVTVSAADLPSLLAAWTGELVRLAEREDFVPERVVRLRLANLSIRATVAGERALPRELIEDVGSERVRIGSEPDGTWSATVTLYPRS